MGRKRKGPWRRKSDGCWYTTEVGTKRLVQLADAHESYETAFKRYCEFHTRPVEAGPKLTVAQLIDEFLEWLKQNRSPRTYEWYRDHLRRFYKHHGPHLRVAKLKPYHVDQWLNADYQGLSDSYRHGAVRSIQRVLNWAVGRGFLDFNPIAKMEKPTPRPRETTITSSQFQQTLALYPAGDPFRDYLLFLWETGCRAQEIRVIEARHFDGEKLILEKTNSKGERYNRTIYPTDTAAEIVKRLAETYPTGPLFRDSKGNPWRKNSVRCRFRRLKTALGVPDLCATTLRHSWATEALRNGMDTTTASILMGHRDPATLARNYQHLVRDHQYLRQAAARAKGAGMKDVQPASDLPAGTL